MAGILKKNKDRKEAEIPTSSMADIAFLLLIFFLVTTTIDVDTGIGMTLPPPLEEDVEPPPVRERNMLTILVNAQGQVLMEDKPSSIRQIRPEVVKHVTNRGQLENYSVDPESAIVSFKTDRQTPYELYVEVLDEIRLAYNEIRDSEARQLGAPDYATYQERLGADEENVVAERIPLGISIAEPDAGTEES